MLTISSADPKSGRDSAAGETEGEGLTFCQCRFRWCGFAWALCQLLSRRWTRWTSEPQLSALGEEGGPASCTQMDSGTRLLVWGAEHQPGSQLQPCLGRSVPGCMSGELAEESRSVSKSRWFWGQELGSASSAVHAPPQPRSPLQTRFLLRAAGTWVQVTSVPRDPRFRDASACGQPLSASRGPAWRSCAWPTALSGGASLPPWGGAC